MKNHVIVVSDNSVLQYKLSSYLQDTSYHLAIYSDITPTLTADVMLVDSDRLTSHNIENLNQLNKTTRNPALVILTHKDEEDRILASRPTGTESILEKSFSRNKLLFTLDKIIENKKNTSSQTKHHQDINALELLGEHDKMRVLRRDILKIASSNTPVLLTGERGSGKTLMAKNIHSYSEQADEPFIKIDCSRLSSENQETHLSGNSLRYDLFAQIDGGTLYLNEIADLSLTAQQELIDLLQKNRAQRLNLHASAHTNSLNKIYTGYIVDGHNTAKHIRPQYLLQ